MLVAETPEFAFGRQATLQSRRLMRQPERSAELSLAVADRNGGLVVNGQEDRTGISGGELEERVDPIVGRGPRREIQRAEYVTRRRGRFSLVQADGVDGYPEPAGAPSNAEGTVLERAEATTKDEQRRRGVRLWDS
jgi:hypothetical protein